MNFAEYAPLAARTLKVLPYDQHVRHMALGMCGELGEALDVAKRLKIYGKPYDKANALEEVGDALWYIVNLCETFDIMPARLDKFQPLGRLEAEEIKSLDAMSDALLACNLNIATVGVALLHADLKDSDKLSILQTAVQTVLVMCLTFEITISDAMETNIAKLQKRYGDKYSDYSALNRDLDAERAILDAGASK